MGKQRDASSPSQQYIFSTPHTANSTRSFSIKQKFLRANQIPSSPEAAYDYSYM